MKLRHRIALSVALIAIAASGALAQGPCEVPDNGTGTVDLPPPGCPYLSPAEFHEIVNGLMALPAEQRPKLIHSRFINVQAGPGGNLGGEVESFDSELTLQMEGTGELAGFTRTIVMQVNCEAHTAPRTPGDAVQDFETDMFMLQGQIAGDPDFDQLTVTAGTGFGLPSPGHTTLTRLGGAGSDFQVDSFFDITYRIDFAGAAGSVLDGMSGTTTATIHMQTTPQHGGAEVPAVSPWGLVLLSLLILGAGALVLRWRRHRAV
ncbi:MAG: IPTL-CTERM sorting domain-containing protein [Candidatus Krumholzibacteriia bacterium]